MPIDPLSIAAGAGFGLLKDALFDGPREAKERQLAAATQRYSPWTGLKANEIHQANPLGDALQGGMTGLAMSQNASTTDAYNKYLQNAGGAARGVSGIPDLMGSNPAGGKPNLDIWGGLNRHGMMPHDTSGLI